MGDADRPQKNDPSPTPGEPSSVPKTTPDASNTTPEVGGPKGLEPTRYGDWERKGRCVDF